MNSGDDRKRPKGSQLLPLAPADEVIQTDRPNFICAVGGSLGFALATLLAVAQPRATARHIGMGPPPALFPL